MIKLITTKVGISTVVAIATLVLLGTGTIAPVSAQVDPARGGLDRADVNVHENTGSTPGDLSRQDIRFHQGTCQGGHSTTVLDTLSGCGGVGSPGGPLPK
jgi:hypothetical protein